MSEQYAEFKCIKCNIVVTMTGSKVIYGPDKQQNGPCSGNLAAVKDHYWQKIRTWTR